MREMLEKSELLAEVREAGGGLSLVWEALKFVAVIPIIERLCDKFPRYVINHGIEPLASLDGIWLIGMGLISFVALAYLALWEGMRPRHAGVRFSPWPRTVRGFATGYVVGALIMTSAVLLASFLGGFTYAVNLAQADVAAIALVALLYVFQAFGEEVLYRGACMMSIARKNSAFAAIVVSSLYFSLHHHFNAGYGPVAFVNLFLLAVLLAITVFVTNRIWMATAIHAAWNFFQGNVWGINVSGGAPRATSTLMTSTARPMPVITGGDMGLEGSLVTTAVLLVVLIAVAWLSRSSSKRVRS
ncbi:MAG: CPBP family intramembrane metalloprotease [Atopobiaceae bacterium]|nr:CPBP family intramembrane metalloprotease [Atopobiaceae bacterium]